MTINFGLLGAGRIGKTHATAILGIPGTKLSAVFDPVDAARIFAAPKDLPPASASVQ